MAATPQIIRVIDLETTGTTPDQHGVCEIGWQDVAQGADGSWDLEGEGGSRLVNPGRPIPPLTMAVHHIRDQDVADAPWWHDVARPILNPWPPRVALAAHRASFEEQFCTPALTRGADWICTWKCALRLWPDSPGFSNQFLRYYRDPAGLDHERGLPAHRAFPDAYVTAFHLRDMLNEAGVEQLVEWSKLPGLLPRVRYGPYRGKEWREVDDDALDAFLHDRDIDIRYTAEVERGRRRGDPLTPRAAREPSLF
jgi:exodeoxyribonuclease X